MAGSPRLPAITAFLAISGVLEIEAYASRRKSATFRPGTH